MKLDEFNGKIERLRFANRWTWEEIATALELSRVMLLHLRKGTHKISDKTLQRLDELERKSGAGADAGQWIQAITERTQEQTIRVTASDVLRGELIAKVEYLVPSKLVAGLPATVKLERPPVHEVSRLITNLMLDEDFDSVLQQTLPSDLNKEKFLNAISPFSYRELVEAAMVLVFGFEWTKRLPKPPGERAPREIPHSPDAGEREDVRQVRRVKLK